MRYTFSVNGKPCRDTFATRQAATTAAFFLAGTALCGIVVRPV